MQHSARPDSPNSVKPNVIPWYVSGFLATGLLVTASGLLPDSGRTRSME